MDIYVQFLYMTWLLVGTIIENVYRFPTCSEFFTFYLFLFFYSFSITTSIHFFWWGVRVKEKKIKKWKYVTGSSGCIR